MPLTAINRADVRKWHTHIQASCVSKSRDLQQRIKGQSWIADGGGVEALKAALIKLEKWLWIDVDEGDERWRPRADLLDRRW